VDLGAYWPWWLGGIALAATAVGYSVVERRALGVSGKVTAVLDAIEHPEDERAANRMAGASDDALAEALLAATREEFGETASAGATPATVAPSFTPPRTRHVPATAQAAFLGAVALGAFLATMLRGGEWAISWSLGDVFERLVGGGPVSFALLLGGGVMVGFGTRMAGGCTSGHGLCGSARLQPGSLAATASFFGAAVAFSFLMEWLR
jgi:uncharacterized membrane protein YedE/YeeE